VNCGILSLTGQLTMASGMSLTSTTAHVVGNLSVAGGGAFVVTALDFGMQQSCQFQQCTMGG